jgi:hypothetical protein
MFVDLTVGQRFPRMVHECWWTSVDEQAAETAAKQDMCWEGGPGLSAEGKRR